MSAKLIMLDGPDGVGKTTQIILAAAALTDKGLNVLSTRINGGSPIGEALRKVYIANLARPAATDFHLGLAIYAAFVVEIDRLRTAYDVILVDRSPLSNVSYQSFGSGYPKDEALAACADTIAQLKPDSIICYTAPLDTLRERLEQSHQDKPDYFESKPDDYFEKVIEGYTYTADHFDANIIDASADSATVQQQTIALINQVLVD